MGLIVLVFVLVACAPQASPGMAGDQPSKSLQPKRLVAGLRGDPFTLNDRINTTGAGSIRAVDRLEKLINTGLALEDDDGRLHPRLAEEVPSSDNGLWKVAPDGRMTTTWRLRRDALWHDGVPFTSADLLFTGQVGRDKELPFAHHLAFDMVEDVEAPDPSTLTVVWKRPFIEADLMFSTHNIMLPLPKHRLEQPYREEKESFTQLPFWTEGYVGTGPFRMKTWVRSSHMVLEANERYVLGRPRLDEIEVRFIPDPHTLIANALAGEVQLTLASLSLDQGLQVRDQWKEGSMRPSPSTTTWIAVWPQLLTPNPPIIGDPRFRRALLHAIDREEITQTFNAGLSPVAHSPVHPNRAEYASVQASIARYDYDVRKASDLIEELGYTKGPDGVFRTDSSGRDGQRLAVEIRVTATDDAQLKPAFAIADYWSRAGLNAEPVPVPPQRAVDRAYRSSFPGFEVVRQSAQYQRFGDFRSSETPLPENNYVGKNRTRYMNPEYDALIDRLLVTIPMRDRLEILSQIIQHMTDRVIIMGLFFNVGASLVSHRLVGIDGSDVWRAHDWDIAS